MGLAGNIASGKRIFSGYPHARDHVESYSIFQVSRSEYEWHAMMKMAIFARKY
jgi:hypothetical protein